ncbi:MAG: 3-hydroxyisobutyrate dehydrogenase [Verrucomicrobia bacterium]|jgi:3-hydroxyisobutyrate dehydrogenase-like beta-hydroxyacid dehydrogenase|nr:MAG: 3-hydroxyisobutyrate dehydrogenase [Verrucomicrobiota bacterium]
MGAGTWTVCDAFTGGASNHRRSIHLPAFLAPAIGSGMFSGRVEKVGVIGLGIVGSRVAENLRKAQKHVYVWSRTPKPEPNFMGSPAEIAANADAVQIFVTNGEALIQVIEAMEPNLNRGHLILNHATIDVATTRKAAQIVEAHGASFLDCPFTGSRMAAEKGQLVYYAGGDAAVLDKARPLLAVTSKHILHVGGIGDATVLKITTNMISGATVQILSEALAVTEAHGIDGQKLLEALGHNACCSDLIRMKLPSILNENYEPHFSLKNMFKDAQIALALANAKKIETPALSTTASVMFKTLQQGHGEEDYSVLAANYRKTGEADHAS